MGQWHDNTDSDNQLKQDVKVDSNPHSVAESAKQELQNRGYSDNEITNFSWRD